jgi:hypothetical protein
MNIAFTNPATPILFLAAALAGGLAGQTLKNRVPGLRGRDQVRAIIYLTRYSAALEYYGISRRELRARVDELRGDLGDAAGARGVATAIAGFGSPRALAAGVAGDRLSPSWLRGTLWVGLALLGGMVTLLVAFSAFLGGFESVAAPGDTASWSGPLWIAFEATAGDDGRASRFAMSLTIVPVALLVVVFLLGARVWRVRTGRGAPATAD